MCNINYYKLWCDLDTKQKAKRLLRIYRLLGGERKQLKTRRTVMQVFAGFADIAAYQNKYQNEVEIILDDIFNMAEDVRTL